MMKAEIAILDSRNPDEYIEASLKSRLSPAAKARLARQWMEKTGYTREDILYARNRHPYWRKKKMEGSVERTRKRLEAHNYSTGETRPWTKERVEEFISLNGKDKAGRYIWKDWQLAEHFGASIPSIQYMRRKCHKVEALLGPRAQKSKLLDYLLCAESVLGRGSEAVEASFAAAKEKAREGAASGKQGARAGRNKVASKAGAKAGSRQKLAAKTPSSRKAAKAARA
jgi:hypothetical protein